MEIKELNGVLYYSGVGLPDNNIRPEVESVFFYINEETQKKYVWAINRISGVGNWVEFGDAILWEKTENGGYVLDKDVTNVSASGVLGVAHGNSTHANGKSSHAEGASTNADGEGAHAEGNNTSASGKYSHAEGEQTTADGKYSHSEGQKTTASNQYAHAEGSQSTASGKYSHAEGNKTIASSNYAHAEGGETQASGECSHTEGQKTYAYSDYSHAEGRETQTNGHHAHAEGYKSNAAGDFSHAEGSSTNANGDYSHAEGRDTTANAGYSHSEGYRTSANHEYSHAEGRDTAANNKGAHAEGVSTEAAGFGSHAEGNYTIASGNYSHVEGLYAVAGYTQKDYIDLGTLDRTGENYSYITSKPYIELADLGIQDGTQIKLVGYELSTYTINNFTSIEIDSIEYASFTLTGDDQPTVGTTNISWYSPDLYTETSFGNHSHAEGCYTVTTNDDEHAEGRYNVSNTDTIHSIGIGTGLDDRKNAVEVTQNGDFYMIGVGSYQGTDTKVQDPNISTVQEVINGIHQIITDDEEVVSAALNDLKIDINRIESECEGAIKSITVNGTRVEADSDHNVELTAGTLTLTDADDKTLGLFTANSTTLIQIPEATSSEYGFVKVDNTLDSTSTNPVENRVITSAISSLVGIRCEVVSELPATGENGVIYFVPNGGSEPNIYDEYIWIDSTSKFELIGTTEIDLSNYVTNDDLNAILLNYVSETDLANILNNYVTDSEFDDLIEGVNTQLSDIDRELSTKQDKLTAGYGINITGNTISVNGNFVTESNLNERLSHYLTDSDGYVISSSINDLYDTKQDKLTAGNNITISNDGVISADVPTVGAGNLNIKINQSGTVSTVSGFNANQYSDEDIIFSAGSNVALSASGNTITISATGGSTVGTLNTTNTTSLTPQSSESLSGTINLHKISKTGSYNDLSNKPAIPTVGNGSLHIKVNQSDVIGFSANQISDDTITFVAGSNITLTPDTTNKTITVAASTSSGTITRVKTTAGAHTAIDVSSGAANFNVPTKTSHLTNDSGFLTSHQSLANIVANSASSSTEVTSATSNPYVNLLGGGTVKDSIQMVGGTGISVSGTAGKVTINHSNSVTAGTASEGGSTRTLVYGGTFNVPSVTYDSQGHITGKGSVTLTLPASDNTDTKVTSVNNHYTPTGTTTISASGATGTAGTTVQVVTGITMDAKGHVTAVVSGAATDTRINIAVPSTDATYPILLGNTNAAESNVTSIQKSVGLVVNPSKKSVAEGQGTTASGSCSHAEGSLTNAIGDQTHAEGKGSTFSIGNVTTKVSNTQYTLSGITVTIDGSTYTLQVGDIVNYNTNYAKVTAINGYTITIDQTLGADVGNTISIVKGVSYVARAHSEGYLTAATNNQAHAEGVITIASGNGAHAEGNKTKATGAYSHTEGEATTASASGSHAEGQTTTASAQASHAEGYNTITTYTVYTSNTRTTGTDSNGYFTHAEGNASIACGSAAHAEGFKTLASGSYSHASGQNTIANRTAQTVVGKYNDETLENALFVVGNGTGTDSASRSNAFYVKNNGDVYARGAYYAAAAYYAASDKRKKDIIGDIDLEKTYSLLETCQTVTYTWKDDESKKPQVGVIAQEIQQFFPEIVNEDEHGMLSVDYSRLTVILMSVIKNNIKEMKSLEERIKLLEEKIK